jgi:hypothetical protein
VIAVAVLCSCDMISRVDYFLGRRAALDLRPTEVHRCSYLAWKHRQTGKEPARQAPRSKLLLLQRRRRRGCSAQPQAVYLVVVQPALAGGSVAVVDGLALGLAGTTVSTRNRVLVLLVR